jgi:arylsulfatase A-like enzyme
VHYIDPHEPYEPPDSIGDPLGVAGRPERSLEWLIGRYDTSIRFTDDQLGRLVDGFEATRRADGALVVITADHGEGFLEHGWRSHGAQIYEEAVRVPLLVIWRGVLEGPRLVERPVTLADLPPTVLGLLGGVDASGMRGTDLRAWLEGTAAPEQAQPVFMERQTYERDGLVGPIPLHTLDGLVLGGGVEVAGREFGVRLGRWKYLEAPLETPSRELYDLVEDPLETRNLADLLTGRADRLSALLARWRATAPPPAPAPALSEEERARLGALGYRSPGTAPPAPPGEPPR